MMRRTRTMIAAVMAALLAVPAAAQFSDSYNFLKAVRDRDGDKVQKALDVPGSPVINTRDYNTGEGVLHILVKRRDTTWLGFMLAKGAKPDMRDAEGNTPLGLAAQVGYTEGVQLLLDAHASIDLDNTRGETPLIFAVHNRDVGTVRMLLAAGANPKRADRIAGKSAHDYAQDDPRAGPILKLLDAAKPAKPIVKMGPTL